MSGNSRMKAGQMGSSKGFTLIEFTIVLLLVGLLTAIATPTFRQWRSSLNANQTARGIVNIIMEARSKAIAANYQHEIQLDIPNSQYRMSKGSQAYNTPGAGWTVVSGYDWSLLPSGVTMTSGSNCDLTATVYVQFNANGTVRLESPPGTAIPGPVTVCVQGGAGSKMNKIMVSPSGRITLN